MMMLKMNSEHEEKENIKYNQSLNKDIIYSEDGCYDTHLTDVSAVFDDDGAMLATQLHLHHGCDNRHDDSDGH